MLDASKEVSYHDRHDAQRGTEVSVVDVDWSKDYRKGHVPGAWYRTRSRLCELLTKLPDSDTVVLDRKSTRLNSSHRT